MGRGSGDTVSGVISAVIRSDKMDSSALATADYDTTARFLTLRFNSGAIYQYSDVTPDTYHGLMAAESKGRYFQDNIVGHYSHKRLA